MEPTTLPDRSEPTQEGDLERLRRELREARQTVRALEQRLEREAAERDDLVAVLSHELRTPVTVIAGYGRLLLGGEAGPLAEEQRRFLEAIAEGCQRLSDLIGMLLEQAAQARGEVRLVPRTLPLAPTIQEVAGRLKPLLEQKRLRLEIELRPEASSACFDAPRLEQVLTNLLANAIRYAPPESAVRVAARAKPATPRPLVEVSVSDEGPGVPPRDRERIFRPYVRGSSRDAGAGLGLGLAISRRLVEAHGGSIGVAAAPGGGACFVFTLPADAAAVEAG